MRRVCLNKVHDLARLDERVLYVGSDPGPGTLAPMKEEFPDRFFIEGIAEANVIGMAAGLAMEGFIPYVNTIATFITRRCYEQIAVDICMHNLPVRLIGNGGGLVYAPLGPTHQAIEDIAIMRVLPNMTVISVSDAEEMAVMMEQTLDRPGPIYIRLGKGGDPVISKPEDKFKIGEIQIKENYGDDILILSTGIMTKPCLDAAIELSNIGIKCRVAHMPTIKPLDVEGLQVASKNVQMIVSVEEHLKAGGMGSAVLETLVGSATGLSSRFLQLGLPDQFAHNYGSQNDLLSHFSLDCDGIVNSIKTALAS